MLHDLKHGSILNAKKKKYIEVSNVKEVEPENVTFSSEIHSVFELIDSFKPHEREEVVNILLDFTYSNF